jgi:hypothetical protein
MKKIFFVFAFLFFFSMFFDAKAEAANWYVRPSGGGGSGTSWTAAWNGLGGISWGSVSCGDTIWVAGGTYSQDLNPQKSCSSGSRLYIRRARSDASECTGSPGWSSSFDSTVHQTRAGIYFNGNYNYITISGRKSASGGGNGWWIDFSGASAGPGIEWPNGSNASYNTVEYLDLQGPGNVTYSSDGRGIDLTPFSSATGNTFSHMKIFNWESGVYNVGINSTTFEYIDMYDIMAQNWSSYHPNGIYISGSDNGIVRYSSFHKGPGGNATGEGIFFEQSGGASNWQIYGNVFYDINMSGTKAIEITSTVPNLKIWNNTFDNVGSLLYVQASAGSGSEFKNNLFYNSGSSWSFGASSNNVTASSESVFVNRATRDYRIVSSTGSGYPRNAGTALTSDGFVNRDPDGNSRGSDGSWDVGAYEYGSGGNSTPVPTYNPTPTPTYNPTPTPIVTPSPLPTGQPNPSTKFVNGQQVRTNTTANVRQAPAGALLGSQTSGSIGIVTAGPSFAVLNGENVWWWTVNFTSGVDGWVGEDMLDVYSSPSSTPIPAKRGDLNNSGHVDVTDLGIFLSNWNSTSRPPSDLNQDGRVDVTDLGILLSNWG